MFEGYISHHEGLNEGISSSDKSDSVLKIPPNSFMIFMQQMQASIAEQSPNQNENQIQRTIGKMWMLLPEDIKEDYRNQSKALREKFRQENPDFIDRPKKKKQSQYLNEKYPQPIRIRVVFSDNEELMSNSAANDNVLGLPL